MPSVFLSPSVQEFHSFVIGGTEQQYMNELADEMEPYLTSNGIRFARNDPDESLTDAINQSNSGKYDLHVALQTASAPPATAGTMRGSTIYYNAASSPGRRAAQSVATNYKTIYPDPSRVRMAANTTLAELTRTTAPAVLMEIVHRDNREDAEWMVNNFRPIARNLTQALTQYFGLPFVEAQAPQTGTVATGGEALEIRRLPNTGSAVLGSAENGDPITVLGRWSNWYVVDYKNRMGYAVARYIRV